MGATSWRFKSSYPHHKTKDTALCGVFCFACVANWLLHRYRAFVRQRPHKMLLSMAARHTVGGESPLIARSVANWLLHRYRTFAKQSVLGARLACVLESSSSARVTFFNKPLVTPFSRWYLRQRSLLHRFLSGI